jgi:spermidine synthase
MRKRPDKTAHAKAIRSPGQDAIVLGVLFTSGAAALIYQVCWIRTASLIFGSTTFAVSTVFAVFFLGLAVGSSLFGRVAHRTNRPLRLFALLEIGLGVFALVTPQLFSVADGIYGVAYRAMPDAPWLLGVVRTGLLGLVIVPATVLMGAPCRWSRGVTRRRAAGEPERGLPRPQHARRAAGGRRAS